MPGIDSHLYRYGFVKGKLTKNKWKINKKIKNFRNLKDIDFEFIRGGITIIVGENTNLLDYIYEKNQDWDKFEVSEKSYRQESSKETKEGWTLGQRHSWEIFSPFFPTYLVKSLPDVYHRSNPHFLEKHKKGKVNLSYKIYFFDLTASTSFLTKEGKKDLKFNKVKFRNCEFFYGKINEKSEGGIQDRLFNYYILESDEKPKGEECSWTPRFEDKENFIKHQDEEKETIYYGLNQNVSHPLDKLGSGYLKIETIKSLIQDLKELKQEPEKEDTSWSKYNTETKKYQSLPLPEFIHTPILLMDEPEIFLHPSLISDLAKSIKESIEKNITTILTTHSPSFLLNFINFIVSDEDEGEDEIKTRLIIVQKDKKNNSSHLLYFDKIIKEIKGEIEVNYKEFVKKNENIDNRTFYTDKWKILFNQETLRIFFARKVLFVEGMTEYLLFNNILREELYEELNDIEIIPIFGKYHYIFFMN